MSGVTYNGRRAPNVSAYLANLNNVVSPANANASTNELDDFSLPTDLDFLTNTEFFDFDTFESNDFASVNPSQNDLSAPTTFPFNDFHNYNPIATATASPSINANQSLAASPAALQLPGTVYPNNSLSGPNVGDKRKASHAGSGIAIGEVDIEETARVAAEEDKRRRNTAASARFRVKKKQREQALEKENKEMTERMQKLEGKVQQLERENKWLKELLTEKSEGKTVDVASSKSTGATIAAAAAAAADESSPESRTATAA